MNTQNTNNYLVQYDLETTTSSFFLTQRRRDAETQRRTKTTNNLQVQSDPWITLFSFFSEHRQRDAETKSRTNKFFLFSSIVSFLCVSALKKSKTNVTFLLCFLVMSCCCFADEVKVHINQTKLGLNESFTLVFTSLKKNHQQPDFAKLQEDFDVLSNSVESHTMIINGKFSEETKWTVHLIPKRLGNLIIPAISFGEDSSLPINVEVGTQQLAKPDDAIFVEVELNPSSSVFVQTPLVYTIKLYTSLQLAQGTLSDLKTNDPDAIIEKIAQDKQYETFHKNGKRYTVVERTYTIIPQHVGEFIVYPIQFEGTILTRSYSLFDHQTSFKRMQSQEKKIEIKPQVASGFLANKVVLSEKWSANPDKINLGEPITWEITLKADGILANQIPDPIFTFPKDLKFYLDKPEVSNVIDANGISSTKQIKIAIIPSKTGDFTIPELNMKWVNTRSANQEEISLPKRILHVINEDEVAVADEVSVIKEDALSDDETDEVLEPVSQVYEARGLIAMTLFALISSILFLIYLKMKAKRQELNSLRQLKNPLRKACLNNNAKQAEAHLLALMALYFPEIKPLNLISIKKMLPLDFQAAIDELNQSLYQNHKAWDGTAVWKACQAFRPQKKRVSKKPDINKVKTLYPS